MLPLLVQHHGRNSGDSKSGHYSKGRGGGSLKRGGDSSGNNNGKTVSSKRAKERTKENDQTVGQKLLNLITPCSSKNGQPAQVSNIAADNEAAKLTMENEAAHALQGLQKLNIHNWIGKHV